MRTLSDRTYQNLKLLISTGNYEYEDMMRKLDLFLMFNRITEEQYIELVTMITPPKEEEEEEEITDEEDVTEK